MEPQIGIDEAGRGPLAGPLTVCALRLSRASSLFGETDVRDSKKLSAKRRELMFAEIEKEQKTGRLDFAVAFVEPRAIDEYGMALALKTAIKESLKTIRAQVTETILLDGALKAPEQFTNQSTIIKGDETEQVIALASIAAKVLRDRKMLQLAEYYPEYDLGRHKGYGTKAHREAITSFGLTPIHRASFCQNISIKTVRKK